MHIESNARYGQTYSSGKLPLFNDTAKHIDLVIVREFTCAGGVLSAGVGSARECSALSVIAATGDQARSALNFAAAGHRPQCFHSELMGAVRDVECGPCEV